MQSNIPHGKEMFRVVETFSGIGAQAKAFERISEQQNFEFEIINTCDWDVNAIIAYAMIHKHGINVSNYQNVSDEEIDAFLSGMTISMDGKKPINPKSYKKLTDEFKRLLFAAIHETKNLVSITDVRGSDIASGIDMLTYSFPCQDLSMCGYWHGNKSGISRDAHNRSGMLWEVERILKEMHSEKRELPHFLMMENVTNILSSTHKEDFDDWKKTLTDLGYYNKIYRLNARNFGVPQKRERAYMISVLCKNSSKVEAYFAEHNLEDPIVADIYKSRTFRLKDVLRLDYRKGKYKREAELSQPNDTPSRDKIFQENDMLYRDKKINEIFVNTVTTKQDRNPNSGLISFDSTREGKAKWRYLTPRECFMLMGFDEQDYEYAIAGNILYSGKKNLLTQEKMYKMAGNSICVDVLEALFKQIIEINSLLFS